MHARPRVEQPVVRHRVDECLVADGDAPARLPDQIRRVRHALHATGDHDVRLPSGDRLRAERHRLQAGSPHLVHRERGDFDGHARIDTAPVGRVLAEPGLEHVAHDDLVDGFRPHAGALERLLDDEGAELDRGEALQPPAERSDGGAAGAGDHDVSHHVPPEKSTAIRSSVAVSTTCTNARRRSGVRHDADQRVAVHDGH